MAYKIKDADGNELIIYRGKHGFKITVLTTGHDRADFYVSKFDWELLHFLTETEGDLNES